MFANSRMFLYGLLKTLIPFTYGMCPDYLKHHLGSMQLIGPTCFSGRGLLQILSDKELWLPGLRTRTFYADVSILWKIVKLFLAL